MEEVFEEGMYWLILKADAIKLFPEIPRLVQAARQAIGQVQKVEGIFELLEAIQSLIPSAETNRLFDDPRSSRCIGIAI